MNLWVQSWHDICRYEDSVSKYIRKFLSYIFVTTEWPSNVCALKFCPLLWTAEGLPRNYVYFSVKQSLYRMACHENTKLPDCDSALNDHLIERHVAFLVESKFSLHWAVHRIPKPCFDLCCSGVLLHVFQNKSMYEFFSETFFTSHKSR